MAIALGKCVDEWNPLGSIAFQESRRPVPCRYGIVVASVAPGFVSTDRVAGKVVGPVGEAIRGQSSWGRVAEPAEVAETVAFAAAFWRVPWVTGAVLDVNGASYLRM